MANLTRVTGKIFGETASTSNTPKEIGQFGSAKLGTYNATGDVSTIQSLSAWSNGWIDAVTPTQQFPSLPEMTGVHKVLSYQNAYLLQKGVAEWDANTTYYTGDICKGVGEGKLYVSIVNENTNHAVTDTNYWELFNTGGGGSVSTPIGQPIITVTNTLEEGELWLEGGTKNISTYPELFAVYGTTWGGNGSTTFGLPDFRGRAIWGSNSFGYISAGLPNITGSIYNNASGADYQWGDVLVSDVSYSGALSPIQSSRSRHTVGNTTASNTPWDGISFNASSSSSIYGSSSTVQPPAIRVRVKTRYE